MKNLINSFKYAIEGIISAFKSERNLKIQFSIMALIIILSFFIKISKYELLICIILFALVISAELFNTAIEILSDIVMPNKNEKIKLVKDISAGAVLIFAIASIIIGFIIFLPKILNPI